MSESPRSRPSPTQGSVDAQRRRVSAWLWRIPVLGALLGGGYGVIYGAYVHFFKRRPDPTPDFRAGPTLDIAALAQFASPWDAVPFQYEGIPAIAVRLPEPVAGGLTTLDGRHLAAFSRVCTHLGCIVTLNFDADAIAFAFNYRADGPQLVCRCHLSVFDPERAGRAVAGPAVHPLPRVALREQGGRLVAQGIEPAPL